MKKFNFKYQRGGAARVFNTLIPQGTIQPFTPLIQVASQPIETGFDAQRFIEQSKLQKIQQQRLAEQMEFEKLKFASDLEQQQIANEQNRIKSTQLITDPILNINSIASDQPRLESLKQKYGIEALPAGDEQSVKAYREAVSKMTRDPEYVNLRRRHLAYNQYQDMLTKGQFKDANTDGYIDEQPLQDFIDGKSDTLIPKVLPGYNQFKENKLTLQKLDEEEKALSIQERQRKIEESKRLSELRKPYEDKKFKLVEEYFKEVDPTKRQELYKQIEEVDGMLNGKFDQQKTTASKDIDFDKATEDQAYQEWYIEFVKKHNRRPNLAEIKAAKAGKLDESSMDIYTTKGWYDYYSSLKGPQLTALKDRLNSNLNKTSGNTLEIKLPNKTIYETTDFDNTEFDPAPSAEPRTDGLFYISGTVYKSIPKKELDDYKDKGWKDDNQTRAAGKRLIRDDDHVIVSAPAAMGVQPNAENTNTNTGLPTPKSYGSISRQDFETVGLKISDPSKWDSFLTKAPDSAKKAMVELKAIAGDALTMFTGFAGDDYNHHDGENGDHNFDVGFNNNPKIATLLTNNRDVIKAWAAKNGYAIVIEMPKGGNPGAFNKLKPGSIVTSELSKNATGPHLHFEKIDDFDPLSNYIK